ncbi:ParB/RepB/Spo0J family partition protein [Campylobacter hominis]|uniref:SpoOJ protein n=1 Tax=Campylobacter hominis (strain ATCC BAA-381 / DSM 21671 / CCUG 45161 / LMG 19568 / NCTC 13146 / CH001A) TaxID=360107 RepID=A7I171_CAMHC|nr:ParB/RepB/Spo0J family partition protein [Campylobacter hominis]ABS50900.1 spoOJ protein [Campylobacter hominis ATCC BAA-381]UAK86423.1 ParB/RepB/Spo0J family partition protein [Campylobacter hominis]SUW84800.1 spoOJ protein [Campylobacter hominis]
MSGRKKALGRGLDAILGDVELTYTKELQSGRNDIVIELEIDKIKPNPYQPRKNFDEEALKELSESIERHGLIQPIIVMQKGDEYLLIAGERRLRATKILGDKTIKAIVADFASQNLRELALIENIQRQDLNPIELANSYKELIDEYKITQEELSDIIKKSRTQITNTIRLLSLSDFTQKMIANNKISQGHAKIMVGLNPEQEKLVVDTVIGQKLSVRETENLVKKIKEKNSPKVAKKINDEVKNFKIELDKLKTKLEKFGKISIRNRKISIEFDEISQISKFIEKF